MLYGRAVVSEKSHRHVKIRETLEITIQTFPFADKKLKAQNYTLIA